jgi:hypothetical protein
LVCRLNVKDNVGPPFLKFYLGLNGLLYALGQELALPNPPNALHKSDRTQTHGYFWHGCFGGARQQVREPPSPPSPALATVALPSGSKHRNGPRGHKRTYDVRILPRAAFRSGPISRIPVKFRPIPAVSPSVEANRSSRKGGRQARRAASPDGAGLFLACRRRVFRRAPATRRRLRFARFIVRCLMSFRVPLDKLDSFFFPVSLSQFDSNIKIQRHMHFGVC